MPINLIFNDATLHVRGAKISSQSIARAISKAHKVVISRSASNPSTYASKRQYLQTVLDEIFALTSQYSVCFKDELSKQIIESNDSRFSCWIGTDDVGVHFELESSAVLKCSTANLVESDPDWKTKHAEFWFGNAVDMRLIERTLPDEDEEPTKEQNGANRESDVWFGEASELNLIERMLPAEDEGPKEEQNKTNPDSDNLSVPNSAVASGNQSNRPKYAHVVLGLIKMVIGYACLRNGTPKIGGILLSLGTKTCTSAFSKTPKELTCKDVCTGIVKGAMQSAMSNALSAELSRNLPPDAALLHNAMFGGCSELVGEGLNYAEGKLFSKGQHAEPMRKVILRFFAALALGAGNGVAGSNIPRIIRPEHFARVVVNSGVASTEADIRIATNVLRSAVCSGMSAVCKTLFSNGWNELFGEAHDERSLTRLLRGASEAALIGAINGGAVAGATTLRVLDEQQKMIEEQESLRLYVEQGKVELLKRIQIVEDAKEHYELASKECREHMDNESKYRHSLEQLREWEQQKEAKQNDLERLSNHVDAAQEAFNRKGKEIMDNFEQIEREKYIALEGQRDELKTLELSREKLILENKTSENTLELRLNEMNEEKQRIAAWCERMIQDGELYLGGKIEKAEMLQRIKHNEIKQVDSDLQSIGIYSWAYWNGQQGRLNVSRQNLENEARNLNPECDRLEFEERRQDMINSYSETVKDIEFRELALRTKALEDKSKLDSELGKLGNLILHKQVTIENDEKDLTHWKKEAGFQKDQVISSLNAELNNLKDSKDTALADCESIDEKIVQCHKEAEHAKSSRDQCILANPAIVVSVGARVELLSNQTSEFLKEQTRRQELVDQTGRENTKKLEDLTNEQTMVIRDVVIQGNTL